jgi:CRISPR-associated protein Cmr3
LGVATDSGWLAGVAHDLDGVVATLPQDVDGTASPVSGWCDGSCLDTYLDGGVPERISQDLWQVERRVGLARTPDRTAAEGMFYSIEHLRPQPGVGFAAQCLGGPRAALAGTVRFGGQGRGAQVHADATVVGMPQQLAEFPGGRMLLYLATPAVFPAGGWIPDLSAWPGVRLVTAAVGSPQVVTTATPRGDGTIDGGRLMWAAPAGSVYYLKFPDAATAADAGTTIHATGLAQDEDWMSTAGFGLAFTGRWQHL